MGRGRRHFARDRGVSDQSKTALSGRCPTAGESASSEERKAESAAWEQSSQSTRVPWDSASA
eukprot:7987318-Alexandrium_andersonii.AAC.1